MSVATLQERLDGLTTRVTAVDARLTRLSLDGDIGPHQPCNGEVHALVGAAAALHEDDWAFWGAQVCAPALNRGVPLQTVFAEALAPGLGQADFANHRIVTQTHGVLTRLPHATGLAWAARQDGIAVLCEFGDAAITDADFHVGLNFAAVMNAPVVFVVRNGASATRLSSRATGYGIRAYEVESLDALAVHETVTEALDAARQGHGPALIDVRVDRSLTTPTTPVRLLEEEIEQAVAAAERLVRNERG